MGRYYCGVKQGPGRIVTRLAKTRISVQHKKKKEKEKEKRKKERKRCSAVAIEKLSFNKSFTSDWEKCYRGTTKKKKKLKNNTYQRGLFGTYVRRATLREKKHGAQCACGRRRGRVKPVMLLGQNVLGERKIIIQKWRSRAAANVLEGIRIGCRRGREEKNRKQPLTAD